MKRTVQVVTTKDIEIDIPDDKLTPQALAEFSSYMWKVEKPEQLFQYAAAQVAAYGDTRFLEGLGIAADEYNRCEGHVIYNVTFEETETEIAE